MTAVAVRQMFQLMPGLTPEQYESLRRDIAARGVLVPAVVDQHGRTIDGHNRRAIAADLGIECPVEVRAVADDQEAADLAVVLNCARRHLTREQTRLVIRGEIERRPDDSDRAVARRVGCDHKTVGAVRRLASGEVPQSGMSRDEAERRSEDIRTRLQAARDDLLGVVDYLYSNGIPVAEVVTALTRGQRLLHASSPWGPDITRVMQTSVIEPVLDYALDPDVFEAWRSEWNGAPEFLPLSETDRERILGTLTSLLGGGTR